MRSAHLMNGKLTYKKPGISTNRREARAASTKTAKAIARQGRQLGQAE